MSEEFINQLARLSTSVNDTRRQQETLIENYIAGLRLKLFNQIGNNAEVNKPSKSILSRNKTSEFGNENSTIPLGNSPRGERMAAKVAYKVKKNLIIPLKLRQPSNGETFEDTLRDEDLNPIPLTDVTNGQCRTKVLKKCNRSEVPHLPAVANEKENANVSKSNDGDENQRASSDQSESPSAGSNPNASCSVRIVRMRAKQFENLAIQNQRPASELKSIKKPLSGKNKTLPSASGENSQAAQVINEGVSDDVDDVNKFSPFLGFQAVNNPLDAARSAEKMPTPATSSDMFASPPQLNSNRTLNSSSSSRKSSKKKNTMKSVKSKRSAKGATLIVNSKRVSLVKKTKKKTAVQTQKNGDKRQAIKEAKLRKQQEKAKKVAILKQNRLKFEERRNREEAARLARLEEIEEEYKRAKAAMKKKKEDAEAARQKKLAQDRAAAMRTPITNVKNVKAANVTHTIISGADNYEMTPDRENRPLKCPKNANDYGIDEIESGDSSEDEDHPKKKIPSWAERKNRVEPITINAYIPLEVWTHLYICDDKPQINKLLGKNHAKRPRTSSAIWATPPLRK